MKGSSMGYLLKTGFKNVYMNRLMSFASIGVLVACLMLIGSAVLLSLNMQVIVGAVEDENEMVAFLNMDVSDEQAKQIGEEIKNIPEIEEYYFYSSEEAWAEEQKKWGAASAMVEVDVDGNDLGPILPDAYRIKLKDVSQTTLDSVEQQLLEIDGIDPDIRTPSEEATILSDLERAISTVGGVIVIILAVVSVVIIANTIKITIFSRRKEISIMRLGGATNTFIKMPFIIEGMLIGLISALIAFGGLWVAYNYATQFIMTNPSSWLEIAIGRLINFKDIAHYMLAGFAIGGCGLGIIGSNLFIRRHLKV